MSENELNEKKANEKETEKKGLSKKVWIPIVCVLGVAVIVLIILLLTGSKKETSEVIEASYEGILVDYTESTITLAYGEDDTVEFLQDKDTAYYCDEERGIIYGDKLKVDYYLDASNPVAAYAKAVTVVEEVALPSVYTGMVIDLTDTSITVYSSASAVTFSKDTETVVEGDLTLGDTVEIGYYGNLTEAPYAFAIKVTEDLEIPEFYKIKGTISNVAGNGFSLSLDSSHGYVFTNAPGMEITGLAKELQVGQTVVVTYTGALSSNPVASAVEITALPQEDVHKISGVITKIDGNNISLKNSDQEFVFVKTSDTKVVGAEPAVNANATILYVGTLGSKPTILSIFCEGIKPTPTPTPAPTVTPTATPTPTEEPTPTAEPTVPPVGPVENPMITATGYVVYFDTTVILSTEAGKTITLALPDDCSIAAGYLPKYGDKVKFVYNSQLMELREITLLERKSDYYLGQITEWGDTIKIKTSENVELELTADEKLEIPSGYTPAKDDYVVFKFTGKKDLKLTYISKLSDKDIEALKDTDEYKALVKETQEVTTESVEEQDDQE